MSGNDAIMNYPYGKFLMDRLDLILLRDDELQARIMRIVEHEMVKLKEKWEDDKVKAIEKKKEPPLEPEYYWIEPLSYAQIIARLYKFDSAKASKDKKNTISKGTLRKAINALIDDNYLLRKAKSGSEYGPAQYTLNTKLIEEHMWTRLPKDPWSYLGYNGNPPQVQNLTLPPPKNAPGEVQNLNPPLANFDTGELQNLRLLIDREIELRKTDIKDESKNEEPEVPTHSFTPSQPPSQESFSEEEKPEEVVELSPEEQAIYDFGRETIFKVKPPKITPTVKRHCAKIAKAGIKTLEQMISLVALAKQEQNFKTLHLGNLVNALNGWLLTQQFASIDPSPTQSPTAKAGTARSSYDDDDYVDDTFYKQRPVAKREEVTHATR